MVILPPIEDDAFWNAMIHQYDDTDKSILPDMPYRNSFEYDGPYDDSDDGPDDSDHHYMWNGDLY